jgi:WD40 repeat protein
MVFGTYRGSLLVFESDGRDVRFQQALNLKCNAIKGVCQARGLLFCGSADGILTILDAGTLQVRHSIRGAHDGILNGVAAYAAGFATVSRDRTVRLWSDDGARQEIIRTRHSHSIKCVASNSAGSLLATGSYGGTIDVFSVPAGGWLGPIRRPTSHGISAIAWDEGYGRFVASSYDGNLYDIEM